MHIVTYPHFTLRYKSQSLTRIDAALRKMIAEMFDLMYEAKGIGLAANQVGLPYRFFIVNVTSDPDENGEEFVFINPEIVHRKGSVEGEEGCLSLPELYGQVRRADDVVVDAFGLDGNGFQMKLTELPARVIQHETDHLDGTLFIDRMSETGRREIEPRLLDFQAYFRRQQAAGVIPSDEEIQQQLCELEQKL